MKKAILTVGNTLRGDDGVAAYFGLLLEKKDSSWKVFYGDDTPENQFHKIRDFAPDLLIVCDATTGYKVGSVDIIDLSDDREFMYATHNIPMPVLISYLRKFCKTVLFMGLNVNIENVLDINPKISEEAKATAFKALDKIEKLKFYPKTDRDNHEG